MSNAKSAPASVQATSLPLAMPRSARPVIVGTAGHIDHGKTSLVKALTGIDADRLEEEKRRGITIDIGFAHMQLPLPAGGAVNFGFVDVPGHERFVRNMLAGVGGIDIVLLIIAADESIKPQTREHFEICRLLNIHRGITVITKCDLVDPDTLDVVRLEAEEFVRGSFLDTANAPLVAVSSRTGEGLELLQQALVRIAESSPARDKAAVLRLPIDRVFAMKGFGTVVTGTLVSGSVHKEEEVEVQPSGSKLRVRGVQVHGAPCDAAIAGQRTALNLAAVSTTNLDRGMNLIAPQQLQSTRRADVSLTLLAGAKPLRDRSRVHLHCYTSETIAEVVLHRSDALPIRELKPGAQAFAQLRLADPMLFLPGDRFILRQFSPVVTIGGGIVLDAFPQTAKIAVEQKLSFLQTLSAGSQTEILYARVHRRGISGLSVAEATKETGWQPPVVESIFSKLTPGQLTRVGGSWVSAANFAAAKERVMALVNEFHKANPLVVGIGKEELRGRAASGGEALSAEGLGGILESLLAEKKIELHAEQVRAAGRALVMRDDETAAARKIEAAFAEAGLKVPALKEVLAVLPVDRVRAQKIVTLLLRDRVLVKLGEEMVFHRNALESLRQILAQEKTKAGSGKMPATIDVGRFKELTGISRKYAIPLLEYLDRERVTRRVGDRREII